MVFGRVYMVLEFGYMHTQFFQFDQLRTLEDKVLCVPQELAFEHGEWQGFLMSDDWATYFEDIVEKEGIFLPRTEVEDSLEYQQIIPWAVYKFGDFYLEIKKMVSI